MLEVYISSLHDLTMCVYNVLSNCETKANQTGKNTLLTYNYGIRSMDGISAILFFKHAHNLRAREQIEESDIPIR